jgi:hypothetical protein
MSAPWVGWVWDRTLGEWLSVCDHTDPSRCNRALIRYGDAHGVPEPWRGLTQGDPPRWKPREGEEEQT